MLTLSLIEYMGLNQSVQEQERHLPPSLPTAPTQKYPTSACHGRGVGVTEDEGNRCTLRAVVRGREDKLGGPIV